MGTRNLTCVVKDGEYKTAKYCQWDGYPEGQGNSIVRFLVNHYVPEVFLAHLNQAVQLTSEEIAERWKAHGANDSGWVTFDVADSFKEKNAHLDRDMGGGKFLQYIQDTETPELGPSEVTFAADSLFCEWCYVIDLDTNKLEVYEGFNKTPLCSKERFAFLQNKREEYYPVKFLVSFDINNDLEKKWSEWLDAYANREEEE